MFWERNVVAKVLANRKPSTRGAAAGGGGATGEGCAVGDALGAGVCAIEAAVHAATSAPAIATRKLLQQPIAMTTH